MRKNRLSYLQNRYLVAAGSFLAILAFYLYTLCPDVYLIDSGELAAVSVTLGIAHPTGYPLYTIISYFIAHLPGEPIWNLNLLSGFFSIAAAAFLYVLARRITGSKILAVITISLFAFSPIIWRTSITNEVHALTGLFAILLLFLVYRCDNERIMYLIMYVIGLSLTNHMMIVSLAAPIFIYILIRHRPGLTKIAIGLVLLLFGLTVYYYLIARTHGGAELAWGNTVNIERTLWHISGKQYRVWMFSLSQSEVMKNLINGGQILARNLLYVLAIPSLIGFYVLYKENRGIFWLLLTILTLNVLYTINYSIPDIESYYIPSFIVLVIGFTYGVKQLRKYLKSAVVLLLALAIPIINHNSCTMRGNTFGMDFAQAHTTMLPNSSLLITPYWDIYAPLMYSREIENKRPDLVIIDKELLRRTWYLLYLEREYPDFYAAVKPSVDAYLTELVKFEYGRPYEPQTIQARYVEMLESFIEARMEQGVFFCSPWPDYDFEAAKPQYPRIPFGLVYKIVRTGEPVYFDFDEFKLKRPPIVNDERVQSNLLAVRNMLRRNLGYLQATGNLEQAAKVRELLRTFGP